LKNEGYRNLEIYQLAHDLAIQIHRFSLELPKYELYETGSQLRRASKSISANIVEGYGRRRYKAEFIRFLVFSQASCDEVSEWLEYCKDCYADHTERSEDLLKRVHELGKKLNRFIQSVEESHLSSR